MHIVRLGRIDRIVPITELYELAESADCDSFLCMSPDGLFSFRLRVVCGFLLVWSVLFLFGFAVLCLAF